MIAIAIDVPKIYRRWLMMAVSIDDFLEVEGFASFIGGREDRCLEPFSFCGANGGTRALLFNMGIAIGQMR